MVGKAGASGTVRNPDLYCKAKRTNGDPCGAYALQGMKVCRVHGGATPQAKNRVAKQEIAAVAELLGVPEAVEPTDFPVIAGQYVGLLNQMCTGMLANLRELTDGMDSVDVARDYSDILDRINSTALLVTKMMTAVAALKIATPPPPPPQPPSHEQMRAVLEGIGSRLRAAGVLGGGDPHVCPPCPTCPSADVLPGPGLRTEDLI